MDNIRIFPKSSKFTDLFQYKIYCRQITLLTISWQQTYTKVRLLDPNIAWSQQQLPNATPSKSDKFNLIPRDTITAKITTFPYHVVLAFCQLGFLIFPLKFSETSYKKECAVSCAAEAMTILWSCEPWQFAIRTIPKSLKSVAGMDKGRYGDKNFKTKTGQCNSRHVLLYRHRERVAAKRGRETLFSPCDSFKGCEAASRAVSHPVPVDSQWSTVERTKRRSPRKRNSRVTHVADCSSKNLQCMYFYSTSLFRILWMTHNNLLRSLTSDVE